jgi:hypothetical protein
MCPTQLHTAPVHDSLAIDPIDPPAVTARDAATRETAIELANLAVDDCMFALGQAVGARATLDFEAVVWIRGHFHQRFVAAIENFGDRWAQDRDNVTGAAAMLGHRALRYAKGATSLGVDAIRLAAQDVERYCVMHSGQNTSPRTEPSAADITMLAGYWCMNIITIRKDDGAQTDTDEDDD